MSSSPASVQMDDVRRRSQSLLALSGSAQNVKADVQTTASIPLPLSEKYLHLGAETMLRENTASSTRQELQEHAKDSHVSEIIAVYEQKLSAFLVKALALSQADRLIAQYRFQRAQAEAEVTLAQELQQDDFTYCFSVVLLNTGMQACKLGSLLKETERRREDLQSELSNQVLEVVRSKADMEFLLQHNGRLQQDFKEHQALKGAYSTLLSKSEAHSRL